MSKISTRGYQPRLSRTQTNAAGSRMYVFLFSCAALLAQRPTNPALMEPQKAPEMDYAAVAEPLPLPAGMTMGASASVAFDSKGHLYVLNRGPQPLVEFDENGKFLRAFGEGLFRRTHGLRID